ncbi:MAG: VCBS repeat-containing protein [Opitutaceae bacterium]
MMLPLIPRSLALCVCFALLAATRSGAAPTFAKQKVDSFFSAEGATLADFDGDGNVDLAAGPRIFAGPEFKTNRVYRSPHAFDRLSYSNNFLTYTDDFNRDGRPDILVIGWPGKDAFWYENPGPKQGGDWVQHLAYPIVDTESPGFADVDGDGTAEIIAGSAGRLGFMRRNPTDANAPWSFHPVTPPGKWQRYTHGIGLGDVNGDGRPDLLEANGWWEQPASLAGDPVWKFHAQSFGPGGAQMYTYDVNGDGLADVVTSIAAHGYGISWFEQALAKDGTRTWTERTITSRQGGEKVADVQFSQPHAVMLVDIDGDGLKDVVTGKRHWAHGDKGDPEPNAPAVLYWFKLARGSGGVTFTPMLIDDDSGVGCQFPVGDLTGDGKPDIAIANKKGVFVFRQQP